MRTSLHKQEQPTAPVVVGTLHTQIAACRQIGKGAWVAGMGLLPSRDAKLFERGGMLNSGSEWVGGWAERIAGLNLAVG